MRQNLDPGLLHPVLYCPLLPSHPQEAFTRGTTTSIPSARRTWHCGRREGPLERGSADTLRPSCTDHQPNPSVPNIPWFPGSVTSQTAPSLLCQLQVSEAQELGLRAGGAFFLYLKGHRLHHAFSLCSRKQRPSLLPWSHCFSLWVPTSPPVLNDPPPTPHQGLLQLQKSSSSHRSMTSSIFPVLVKVLQGHWRPEVHSHSREGRGWRGG